MKKWMHRLCALLLGLIVCTQYAVADDIEIYTNPATNSNQPPATILVLDLNLLGVCDNIITNPTGSSTCLSLTQGKTVNELLSGLGDPVKLLTGTDSSMSNKDRALALCNLYGLLGMDSPVVALPGLGLLEPLLRPLLGGVTSLTCGTLNLLLSIPLLGDILSTLLGGFVGQLLQGLTVNVLSKTLTALPAATIGVLDSTLSAVQKILINPADLANVTGLVNSIVGSLANTRLAIVVSHADRTSTNQLLGIPSQAASQCAFSDKASISPGARRNTTNCSNGAYFLAGFLNVGASGLVEGLVGDVDNLTNLQLSGPLDIGSVVARLLKSVLIPNLANDGLLNLPSTITGITTITRNLTATLGDISLIPLRLPQILPPFQGKEVYAEIMQYLGGFDVYNAPLNEWDVVTRPPLLAGRNRKAANLLGGTIDNGSQYIQPNLACRTVNVLTVELTRPLYDAESDTRLKQLLPNLPATFTLDDVIREAEVNGFLDKNNQKINLKTLRLIQNLTGGLGNITNIGSTLGTILFDQVGLFGQGGTLATWIKPTLDVDASLTSPGLTSNLSTPSQVREEAFFPLFKPSTDKTPRWNGNLKRLAVKLDTSVTPNVYRYYDKNGAAAIDSGDGRILSTATTYWSAVADGRTTTLGGAGSKIPGYVSTGASTPGRSNGATGGRTLYYDKYTNSSFALTALNANATTDAAVADTQLQSDLGATAETAAACGAAKTVAQVTQELLLYARGYDTGSSCSGSKGATSVSGRSWLHGALLHSRPVSINYGARSGFTAASPDIRVVYGSADGFMRMARSSDGVETWGFLPSKVASQQKVLRDNTSTVQFPYGVDGAPAVLVQDRSSSGGAADGKLESGNSNDRVWMYFGLRRSGQLINGINRGYVYAMNITNPDSPALMWRLGPDGLYRSGTGLVSGSSTNFAEIGLTFSTPQIGRMSVTEGSGTTTKPVLIFGGGYNGGRASDGSTRLGKDLKRGSDGLVGSEDYASGTGAYEAGNAVYIVDAQTGDLIWKAKRGNFSSSSPFDSGSKSYQHPLLKDSIASDITVLDTNGDGITDRLYVADTGGRLWRADFPGSDRSKWILTPLASVGRYGANSNNVANDRRFFHAPDYAPYRTNTLGNFDVILFGSGDREDPLNVMTQNYLYAYRDFRTSSSLTAGDVVTSESALKLQADFKDLTSACASNVAGCSDSSNVSTGWRLSLSGSGEKVLSQPLSVDGVSYFSTYTPPSSTGCTPSEGSNSLYAVSLLDSRPLYNNRLLSGSDIAGSIPTPAGLPGEFSPLTASALTVNAQTIGTNSPPIYPYFWRERRGDEEKAIRQP